MLEKGEEILTGATILMKALNVERAMIGIENNKPDAIAHITKLATSFKGIICSPFKGQISAGCRETAYKSSY